MDRLYAESMDIPLLERLLDFIVGVHSSTFINFRSFIRTAIERRRLTDRQLRLVSPFLNTHPHLSADIQCMVRMTHLELHGSLPNAKALDMLKLFIESDVAPSLEGEVTAGYRVQEMTEHLTVQESHNGSEQSD